MPWICKNAVSFRCSCAPPQIGCVNNSKIMWSHQVKVKVQNFCKLCMLPQHVLKKHSLHLWTQQAGRDPTFFLMKLFLFALCKGHSWDIVPLLCSNILHFKCLFTYVWVKDYRTPIGDQTEKRQCFWYCFWERNIYIYIYFHNIVCFIKPWVISYNSKAKEIQSKIAFVLPVHFCFLSWISLALGRMSRVGMLVLTFNGSLNVCLIVGPHLSPQKKGICRMNKCKSKYQYL